MAFKHIDYPKTHDLSLLLRLLEDAGADIEPFWPLMGLTPFAVQFRYEVAGEGFPDFAKHARLARQLLSHVRFLALG